MFINKKSTARSMSAEQTQIRIRVWLMVYSIKPYIKNLFHDLQHTCLGPIKETIQ